MNIIVPMLNIHLDQSEQGANYPKPLIELNGKPLIEYVVDNLNSIKGINHIYFILLDSSCRTYHLDNTISLLCPKAKIIRLKNSTSGAICSILMAIDQIKANESCIVMNSDQIFNCDINSIIDEFKKRNYDGAVITFNSVHPRWSYALTDGDTVYQLAEKNPISKNAVAGFYYFKSFELFTSCSFRVILADDNLNGVYYTSSVLNQLILTGKTVGYKAIESKSYLSLYSAQKIKEFETYLQGK